MAYDARQIANWFIVRAAQDNRVLSIMSLLKLTYIAHGWYLEMRDKPLFDNKIEAWQYGPVIPDVYNAYRPQGIDVRKPLPMLAVEELNAKDVSLLEQVWVNYGSLSAFKLSAITHVEGGPWDLTTKILGNFGRIANELIKQHYRLLRAKAQRGVTSGN